MKNANPLFLAVVLLASLGMWGCSQQKTSNFNAKIEELEERHAKLEAEYQSAAQTHRQTQKKVQQLEVERADLKLQVEELRRVVKERDLLKTQLTGRTLERDQLRQRLSQISQDLQSLVGRVESALNESPADRINSMPIVPTSRSPE